MPAAQTDAEKPDCDEPWSSRHDYHLCEVKVEVRQKIHSHECVEFPSYFDRVFDY